MSSSRSARRPVSPNNPCPFLRALVAQGLVADDVAGLGPLARTIATVARAGEGAPVLPGAAIRAIAAIANGLGPLHVARNVTGGVHLDRLRNGPLDKRGAGSRILDANAQVVMAELDRLDTFASEQTDREGRSERGLDLQALRRMMDANFDRAAGHRRAIDRKLMDGEWPVLLKVMGKEGGGGRYLSLREVRELFVEQRLPARMMEKLPPSP